jgi:hypothetical protein
MRAEARWYYRGPGRCFQGLAVDFARGAGFRGWLASLANHEEAA